MFMKFVFRHHLAPYKASTNFDNKSSRGLHIGLRRGRQQPVLMLASTPQPPGLPARRQLRAVHEDTSKSLGPIFLRFFKRFSCFKPKSNSKNLDFIICSIWLEFSRRFVPTIGPNLLQLRASFLHGTRRTQTSWLGRRRWSRHGPKSPLMWLLRGRNGIVSWGPGQRNWSLLVLERVLEEEVPLEVTSLFWSLLRQRDLSSGEISHHEDHSTWNKTSSKSASDFAEFESGLFGSRSQGNYQLQEEAQVV